MLEITNEEYQEYQQLLVWKEKQDIRLSMKNTETLEDDIDEPIKTSLMGLALLGTTPIYSCCGFDYDGQPYHKSHQYGEPYILFWGEPLFSKELPLGWELVQRKDDVWMLVLKDRVVQSMNPHWRNPECIHFSEEIVIFLLQLENWIISMSIGDFDTEVVLRDTNNNSTNPYWQYEGKEDWKITFDDFIDRIKLLRPEVTINE